MSGAKEGKKLQKYTWAACVGAIMYFLRFLCRTIQPTLSILRTM